MGLENVVGQSHTSKGSKRIAKPRVLSPWYGNIGETKKVRTVPWICSTTVSKK